MKGKFLQTDFATETAADYYAAITRIYTVNDQSRNRHQHAASILRHSNGQLLVTCRWDEIARSEPSGSFGGNTDGGILETSAEGDATNEQALYFSKDQGKTWMMANYERPIVGLRNGSSFKQPAAITHSFVFEDSLGVTWIYYTVNQPFTWGEGRPDRSTGGGEIRKIRLSFDGDTWITAGSGSVVWGLMRPVDDGNGGSKNDVRLLSLNGIVRLSNGKLLMPVAGRTTVAEPQGVYWKLNRCWVLESDDDGQTWSRSFYIGGDDGLCLCEPTLVETGIPGKLICYMRVQYNTGNQLYRSVSTNYGHTWSPPRPSGLPNCDGSGAKPFLTKVDGDTYLLLQTNEQDTVDRTGIAIFQTDEAGIQQNKWRLVKMLGCECLSKWKGSCYGWITGANQVGVYYVVYVSFSPEGNFLNFGVLDRNWLEKTIFEPNGVVDVHGDHLPVLTSERYKSGRQSLKFVNVRSRAAATRFLNQFASPVYLREVFQVVQVPAQNDFYLIQVRSNNGRDLAFTVALRPALNSNLWIYGNGGWRDTALSCPCNIWMTLECWLEADAGLRVKFNNYRLDSQATPDRLTSEQPATLIIGGNRDANEACLVYIDEVGYGNQDLIVQ